MGAAKHKLHHHLTGTGAGIESDVRLARETLAEMGE